MGQPTHGPNMGADLHDSVRDVGGAITLNESGDQHEAPEVVPSLQEAVGPSQGEFNQLQQQVEAIRNTLNKPKKVYVARYRARVLHIGTMEELNNPPHAWRTKCGWCYGLTNFIRLSEAHIGTSAYLLCLVTLSEEGGDSTCQPPSHNMGSAWHKDRSPRATTGYKGQAGRP